MSKKEINKEIIKEVRKRLKARGLKGKLDIFPVENVMTRRPRYWNDGTKNLFKVHMWDINSMDEEKRAKELDARIDAACIHFKL